ncbi:uncharacterized protein T551_02156 [Pneumocystis jirovecii RU7]|uniref:Uncharacterized protein n=1 Tax=Pneumocystis jirovecii (strain RU7) TaxID=1408657 RepID=A0A0W4ZMD5_PNEJ7|nr:uncharacterized protein T551_02156 [Pneumocystis jirovecii RU7]KTW29540.1 hypothetical protein T551_02156 [Pneumocystis jirovecii RU7]
MGGECSLPGCTLCFLRFVLPRSFSVTYSPEPNDGTGVRNIDNTVANYCSGLISVLADGAPTLLSGLTECLSSHSLSGPKHNSNEQCPPCQNQDTNQNGPKNSQETQNSNVSKKGLFQFCNVM